MNKRKNYSGEALGGFIAVLTALGLAAVSYYQVPPRADNFKDPIKLLTDLKTISTQHKTPRSEPGTVKNLRYHPQTLHYRYGKIKIKFPEALNHLHPKELPDIFLWQPTRHANLQSTPKQLIMKFIPREQLVPIYNLCNQAQETNLHDIEINDFGYNAINLCGIISAENFKKTNCNYAPGCRPGMQNNKPPQKPAPTEYYFTYRI